MKMNVQMNAVVRLACYVFIVLSGLVSCSTKAQQKSVEFPINCSFNSIKGERRLTMNSKFSLTIPESYIFNDTLDDLHFALTRYAPYKKSFGVFAEMFKMDRSVNFEDLKIDLDLLGKSIEDQYKLNSSYQVPLLSDFEHYAISKLDEEQNGTRTHTSSIYVNLTSGVYCIWITHFEPIEEFDYKGYCEIINILATLKEED